MFRSKKFVLRQKICRLTNNLSFDKLTIICRSTMICPSTNWPICQRTNLFFLEPLSMHRYIGVTSLLFCREKCPYLFTLQKTLYDFISYCTIRTNVHLCQSTNDLSNDKLFIEGQISWTWWFDTKFILLKKRPKYINRSLYSLLIFDLQNGWPMFQREVTIGWCRNYQFFMYNSEVGTAHSMLTTTIY